MFSIQQKKQRAVALLQQQQFAPARQLFQEICKQDPADFESWTNLGIIHKLLSDGTKAESCIRAAAELQPDNPLAHYNLAHILTINGKHEESTREYQRAIGIKPDYLEAWHNLGETLRLRGLYISAEKALKQALTINPQSEETWRALASTYVGQGKTLEAAAACRKTLALSPSHLSAHSLLLFLSTVHLDDPRQIFKIHVGWQQQHTVAPMKGWWEDVTPNLDIDEPIKIGYLSPNFYQHSVAYFFEPLIAGHDHEKFRIYCYSDVVEKDAVTRRIMACSDVWHDTANLSDEQLVEKISSDRIHILVDLAGHTTNNRLVTMMMKPAPVQVQYIGYLNSTGIDRIDYWITDRWTDPPGLADEVSTETIIRLPSGYLCYKPHPEAPDVSAAPWEANGYITFGSFNNICKISQGTIDLWMELLHSIPGSRLLLKNESFLDEQICEEWRNRFEREGIHRNRIALCGLKESVVEHLGMYSHVDVALDTQPYNGTTTTCEALWMGVPVITLPGNTHAGRQGLSLLSQVGLHDLIAGSRPEYIQIAQDLAKDPDRISLLRSTIRDTMRNSTLCDSARISAEVEDAYNSMLDQWPENRKHTK